MIVAVAVAVAVAVTGAVATSHAHAEIHEHRSRIEIIEQGIGVSVVSSESWVADSLSPIMAVRLLLLLLSLLRTNPIETERFIVIPMMLMLIE